jgi:hypothetical protein
MEWSKYFDFDHESGKLFWSTGIVTERSGRSAKASKRFVGKEAGIVAKRRGEPSRITVELGGMQLAAHRIVWEMFVGKIPDGMVIDHIDRDPTNNRLSNLRLATIAQNNANNKVYKNNTSGTRGISWCRLTRKWIVQVRFNGKVVIMKRFASLQEAKEVQSKVAKETFGEFMPNEQLSIQ